MEDAASVLSLLLLGSEQVQDFELCCVAVADGQEDLMFLNLGAVVVESANIQRVSDLSDVKVVEALSKVVELVGQQSLEGDLSDVSAVLKKVVRRGRLRATPHRDRGSSRVRLRQVRRKISGDVGARHGVR